MQRFGHKRKEDRVLREKRMRPGYRTMSKTIPRAVPNMEGVWLNYHQSITLTTGASGTVWAYYVEPNSVLTIDPFVSSTTPGFSVESIKFKEYEPLMYEGWIEFAPLIATSTTIAAPAVSFVCHSLTSNGISSGVSAVDLTPCVSLGAGNSEKMVGAQGAIPVRHTFRRTFRSVFGNTTNTDNFRSATNTVPANTSFLCFGFKAPQQGTAALVTTVELNLRVKVRFFSYIDNLTSQVQGAKYGNMICAACFAGEGLPYTPCCEVMQKCPNDGCLRPCCVGDQSRNCTNKKPKMVLVRPPLIRQLSQKM